MSAIYDKQENRSQVRLAVKVVIRNGRYFMQVINIW